MKISQTVFELQSGHDFVTDRQLDRRQTDGQTDGQMTRAKTICLPTLRGRHNFHAIDDFPRAHWDETEPSLFAHIKYGRRRRIWPKIRCVAPIGLLCMPVWRLSLRKAISAINSWVGSYYVFQCQTKIYYVCMKKRWALSVLLSAQRRLWSDWVYDQADQSLHWTHIILLVLLCCGSNENQTCNYA